MKVTKLDVRRNSKLTYSRVSITTVDRDIESTDRKALAEVKQVLQAAMRADGHVCDKIVFSRTAGCSCGCSPGFIVKEGTGGMQVFATVAG